MTTRNKMCEAISTCVHHGTLEKKWDKLCEIKEEIRKVVVGSDFFQETNIKGHTDNTKVSLGTTLPLCLEVLSE